MLLPAVAGMLGLPHMTQYQHNSHAPSPLLTATAEVLADVALFFAGFVHFVLQADALPTGTLLCTAGVCRLWVFYRIVTAGLNAEVEGN